MQFSTDLYVIEARHPDGSLDLTGPQPESVFGDGAIHGLTTDEMAKAVWRARPDAEGMHGGNVEEWPARVDPRWRARLKTW